MWMHRTNGSFWAPLGPPARCTCSSKLCDVASRLLDERGWSVLYLTPWGPQVYCDVGEQLGILITSTALWHSSWRNGDILKHRALINYDRPLDKLGTRVNAMKRLRQSGPMMHLSWITYCITLFSYVSQKYLPDGSVIAKYNGLLVKHFCFSGILVAEVFAVVGVHINNPASCYHLWGYAFSMFVARSARVKGNSWIMCRQEPGIHGDILRTLWGWVVDPRLQKHHFTKKKLAEVS